MVQGPEIKASPSPQASSAKDSTSGSSRNGFPGSDSDSERGGALSDSDARVPSDARLTDRKR